MQNTELSEIEIKLRIRPHITIMKIELKASNQTLF